MKLLNIFMGIVLVFLATTVHAEDYKCHAVANPDRGFEFAFDIQVPGAKVGSDIILKASGKTKKIGTVTEVATLKSTDIQVKNEFNAILGYIADKDVSGVDENLLGRVTAIQIYKDADSDLEVTVVRLYVQNKQVGGSILIDGNGTSCL